MTGLETIDATAESVANDLRPQIEELRDAGLPEELVWEVATDLVGEATREFAFGDFFAIAIMAALFGE